MKEAYLETCGGIWNSRRATARPNTMVYTPTMTF
jgi:hypothetical protein